MNIGDRVGSFTILRVARLDERLKNKYPRKCYVVQCDCGEIVVKQARALERSTGTDYSMKKRANRYCCDKCRREVS